MIGASREGRSTPIHSAESQGELVREYVKWVDDPRTLYDSVAGMLRARQFALSAPTGPTYVTIDVDVQEELIPENYVAPDPRDFAVARRSPPIRGLIEKAATLLCGAKFPVISAGGRISLFPEATPLLVELVETAGRRLLRVGDGRLPDEPSAERDA